MFRRIASVALFLALLLSAVAQAKNVPGVVNDPDPNMGEYEGAYVAKGCPDLKAAAKVIVEGDGYYRINVTNFPATPDVWPTQIDVFGRMIGNEVVLFSKAMGYDWNGSMKDGNIVIKQQPEGYGGGFVLHKVDRKSPTEGLDAPAGALVLLAKAIDKTTTVTELTNKQWKMREDKSGGFMEVEPGKGDTKTVREDFKDVRLHLEFATPFMPGFRGQARANSGVFFCGFAYEVQILDSFGLTSASGDCGSLYNVVAPRVNASLPPLAWQTYDIVFRAPRLAADGATTTEKPRITVRHNGILIHQDQEIHTLTTMPDKPHVPQGAIMLQDHGNPMRYRNIWLVELKDDAAFQAANEEMKK